MLKLNQRGIVLITVYFVVVVLLVFLLPMLPRSIGEYRIAERGRNYIQALYIAEAGLENAVYQLNLDSNYNSLDTYTSFANGGYALTITAAGDRRRRIISKGYIPDNNPNSYGYQQVTLENYVNIQDEPLFANALFSVTETELKDSVLVDSYNSTLGTYGGDNIGREGNIATNAITNGSLTLKDNASVSGRATVGVGGNPSRAIVIEDEASLSGSKTAALEEFQLPPLPTPPARISSSIDINGTTVLSLDSGTYWYNSIEIKDRARLVLSGPAVLNSVGDIEIKDSGLISTYNNLPANLRINAVNDGSYEVKYKSNQNFYGTIYAPNSEVEIKESGIIFGGIVAKEIEVKDSVKIHYDTALQNAGGGVGFNINDISWRQQ